MTKIVFTTKIVFMKKTVFTTKIVFMKKTVFTTKTAIHNDCLSERRHDAMAASFK